MSIVRIAAKAGVSVATVSRVINNSKPVRPELAGRVRRALEELKLPVRMTARRKRERDSVLAILSVGQGHRAWFQVPVMARIVAELTRAAKKHDFRVMLADIQPAQQIAAQICQQKVDGALLFVGGGVSDEELLAIHHQVPSVRVMGAQLAPSPIDHVTVDHSAVGQLAAEYLAEQKVDEMVFLTCRGTWDINYLRGQAFLATAALLGKPVRALVCADEPLSPHLLGARTMQVDDVEELASRLVATRRGRVGVFIPRDEETVEVYRALSRHSVRLGRDVVVISCDNENVRLSTLHPRPVSIDLRPDDIAARAVMQISHRIEDLGAPPARILVAPRLPSSSRSHAEPAHRA